MWKSIREYYLSFGRLVVVVLLGQIATGVTLGFDISETTDFVVFTVPVFISRIIWLTGVVSFALVVPIYVFHRIRLYRDKIQAELDNRQVRSDALTALAILRHEGVNLRNRGWHDIAKENEEAWWWNEVSNDWLMRVRRHMDLIHTADYPNWVTLGHVPINTLLHVGIDRPEMQRRLSTLTMWFEKLEVYVNERTNQ